MQPMKYVISLNQVDLQSGNIVGGKNASTGEMIQNLTRIGIKVPHGYATTVEAYKEFMAQDGLSDRIAEVVAKLKVNNVAALQKASAQIQRWILKTPFSKEFKKEIALAYTKMRKVAIAVRSSATAEDLADASFAGALESYMNIKGIDNVMEGI